MNNREIRNWAELPPELITSIFLRLSATDLLLNAQKVCISWRRVIKDPIVWRKIEICYLNHTEYDLEDMCLHAVDLNQIELLDIRKQDDNDDESGKEEDDIYIELEKSQRYAYIMQKVKEVLGKDSNGEDIKETVLEDHHEYKLIFECNQLLVDIDKEIVIVHNFIRDKYMLKFPELESLVRHPINYARVVKKISNDINLALVDLRGLLPSSVIMAVLVTSLTTKGNPLPGDVLGKTIEACDRVLDLDFAYKEIFDFVESKMGSIAPNLSAVVGGDVAAKLVCAAGGLSALAKMPACNVQLLGHKKRKNFMGSATVTTQYRVGCLEETELFQRAPPGFRMRASRLLAEKSTLAARVDANREDPSGTKGKAFRDVISIKIEKWQVR